MAMKITEAAGPDFDFYKDCTSTAKSKLQAEESQELRNPDWPEPVGWRILVNPLKPKAISDGGIIKAGETVDAEKHLNYVGQVVALGALCYQNSKFEGGKPWCKLGDWVAYGQYAGQTIVVKDYAAVDAVRVKRKEISEMEIDVKQKTSMLRAAIGTPNEEEHREELRTMQAKLAIKRRELVNVEDDVEHRLRLLNDDEILAVIPNKDAIRIYV